MKQAAISFRLEQSEREAFVRLCAANYVTPSQALRAIVRRALADNCLPIERMPWSEVPETKAAIAEMAEGGGKTFRSVEALMKDLYSGN